MDFKPESNVSVKEEVIEIEEHVLQNVKEEIFEDSYLCNCLNITNKVLNQILVPIKQEVNVQEPQISNVTIKSVTNNMEQNWDKCLGTEPILMSEHSDQELFSSAYSIPDTNFTPYYLSEETLHLQINEVQNRGSFNDTLNMPVPKSKINKGRDYCCYCKSMVLNFSRHLQRHHVKELEVQNILLLPPGCTKRKGLLSILRKRGNYLNSNKIFKPMKKSKYNETSVLPCTNCMGFYSSKLLWRHRKRCLDSSSSKAQASGQNFLVKHLKIDEELKEKVFPRMRPDSISLAAKKDSLICAFGSRYLKTHSEFHTINVTSRKMRELSKLLIEVKNMEKGIENLWQALQPKHFDVLIEATKICGKFDPDKNFYRVPSFVMSVINSLKHCCEIAIKRALKRKEVYNSILTAATESDLRTLIELLETHRRFKVSTQAATDLNINKSNIITIVTLANDLKLLRQFLLTESNIALNIFEHNPTKKNFVTLLELVYCKILILNRRRHSELQWLPLHLYEHGETPEDFSEAVSASEKILMATFKMVVIPGKRGRNVPVLISPDVELEIKTLLEHRKEFYKNENIYLFGNTNNDRCIYGYKIFKKYVYLSGVQNPNSLTATTFRKHSATLCQLFNMTESDVAQLSTLISHTARIPPNDYRLIDDVFQCSKIAKLLLLMEKGEAGSYKGKTLDEIHLNVEENMLLRDEQMIPNDYEGCTINEEICSERRNSSRRTINLDSDITKKVKRILIPWTTQQKAVVKTFFADHIKQKKPPKQRECETLKETYNELLQNKDWLKIKVFIQNVYTKKLK